jgi:hypothetical protein
MPSSIRKNYAGLIIPFGLATLLVAVYWFYWHKTASEVETRVRAALTQDMASRVDVSGFPYRLTLTLDGVKLASAAGFGFKASSVVATATPFNPLLWVLEGAQEPEMALSNGPFRALKANNLKASLRLKPDGFERFSLAFDGIEAGGDQGWSLGGGAFHLVSDPQNPDILALRADLNAIKIGKPLDGPGAILGQTIDRVMLAGPINQGRALLKSPREWSNNGGKLTLMAGELMWGPIAFSQASGEISLDRAQTWQGQVKGQGALKPNGVAVPALAGPVDLVISDNKMSLNGLPGINIANAFGAAE